MSSDGTAATALAPGFRFHPTDEELVSYYLKRKVFGKPFRVDAISELDLYKSEPWDLPGRSRIQSRDMEWYFFSPLDKKYANRSRTSRTTGQGYWKTTGKDRAVRRGARVVGMKKTLVFHVGKAPKGQRTNWVMHEYRLVDEEIVKSGMSQDGYVVCRIFQKNGAGPQNGAQYGAPFVEEEWEEDEGVVRKGDGAEGITFDFGDNLFMQLDDLEHESKVVDNQEENGTPHLGSNDGKNACNNILDKEGSSSSLTQGDDNQDLINFVDHEVRMPEMLDDQGVVGFDDVDLPEIYQNHELPGDDYLELNDFADILDADFFSIKDSVTCNTIAQTTQESTGLLPELQIEEKNADFPEQVLMQMTPSVAENSDVQLEDKVCPVVGDYLSDHQADDYIMYFDALENPAGRGSSFTEMNEFIYPAISMPSKPDPVDELITYFDATEDNLLYSSLENSVILDSCNLVEFPFASEVNKDGTQSQETSHPDPNTSSGEVEGDHSCSKAIDTYVVPGDHSDNGWDKTFKKHLIGMLGSISSPPALAAEYPIKGGESLKLSPANHSSSSIRVTAGVIHLDGVMVSSGAKHWSVQKAEDMHVLSCGCPRDDVICSLAAFGSVGKMQSGIISLLIRSGLCLFSLYFLLRAVSHKMGLFVCSR